MAEAAELSEELAALDALESHVVRPPSLPLRLWQGGWPKLAAIAVFILAWQAVALSGWQPDYLLPGPGPVFGQLFHDVQDGAFWQALGVTLQRAVVGFGAALVLGTLLGMAVARTARVRAAVGALVAALQSMPSIAWFPLAILIFGFGERAILSVVLLGATPSIANGLMSGIDHIAPPLLRTGRSLGAKGLTLYRHVVLPAALPSFAAGLKQGWAFAWRSLMAGELLVLVVGRPSLGARLQFAREFQDVPGLLSTMIVILVIGMCVDGLFSVLDSSIRRRYGLMGG